MYLRENKKACIDSVEVRRKSFFAAFFAVTEFEAQTARFSRNIVDYNFSFGLVAPVSTTGAIPDRKCVNDHIIELEICDHTFERCYRSPIQTIADYNNRSLARTRHQRDKNFFHRRINCVKQVRVTVFS